MDDCLFCKLAGGDVPADVVSDSGRVLAFRDIAPQAPVHVLVIPRDHHDDLTALAAADPALLGEVFREATAVAHREGLVAGGYRVVVNTGRDGGQTVGHLHVHVLGGRALGWPPG